MKYIYIAAPYTKDDPVINTAKAIKIADDLMYLGYIPFIPHLTMFWHLIFPHEIQFWYDYDIAWLKKCDALLRLPGESSGADKEVRIAKQMKKQVYYSIEELLKSEEDK